MALYNMVNEIAEDGRKRQGRDVLRYIRNVVCIKFIIFQLCNLLPIMEQSLIGMVFGSGKSSWWLPRKKQNGLKLNMCHRSMNTQRMLACQSHWEQSFSLVLFSLERFFQMMYSPKLVVNPYFSTKGNHLKSRYKVYRKFLEIFILRIRDAVEIQYYLSPAERQKDRKGKLDC